MECTVGTWLRWMWSCGVRDFGKRSRGWMVREKALDDRLRGLTLIPKATRSQKQVQGRRHCESSSDTCQRQGQWSAHCLKSERRLGCQDLINEEGWYCLVHLEPSSLLLSQNVDKIRFCPGMWTKFLHRWVTGSVRQ